MTDHDITPISRRALLGRRLLLFTAVAVLIGSIARTPLGPSIAMADAAPLLSKKLPSAQAPLPPARAKATLTGRLNLNTASEAELERLPGVGPTKAERVLAFRGKHGPFKRVFDLRRVKGFGKKTVDRLAPFLTVTEMTSLRSD